METHMITTQQVDLASDQNIVNYLEKDMVKSNDI